MPKYTAGEICALVGPIAEFDPSEVEHVLILVQSVTGEVRQYSCQHATLLLGAALADPRNGIADDAV